MDEIAHPINVKTSILLSRNTPAALVIGAAGFLGSFLIEALLDKGIQVVGVDDFSSSSKENLEKAIRDKNFHLIVANAQSLNLGLDRLDYIFICAGENWDVTSFLKNFSKDRPRILFISWIDLYDKHSDEKFRWFKEEEERLARFAKDNNLNARILRLGQVFGPRMKFDANDPTGRLIHSSIMGEIQKEETLDFSSRSLFVTDAADLMIKSMLKGSTAQRIFDGVNPTPIKVAEIKQVLLDPVWHESRGFTPSELPPWPTPNLEKTRKFLNWKPRVGLVEGLRQTLNYFKDREIKFPKLEMAREKAAAPETEEKWPEDKKRELVGFKAEEVKARKSRKRFKISFSRSKLYLLGAMILIMVGLVYPLAALGWGVLTFRWELKQAADSLSKGEFDKSLSSLALAKVGIDEAKTTIDSLEIIRKLNILNDQFDGADRLLEIGQSSTVSVQGAVRGVQGLYLGLKATTGESTDQPFDHFKDAQLELGAADDNISSALAVLENDEFKKQIPLFFKSQVLKLDDYLNSFNKIIKKAKNVSIILPEIIASNKSYLLLLQNNMELRPTGGFIGSYGLVSFAGGKLNKLEVNDIYAIDGQLKIHVEPPKEIKDDLGQNDWFLRDANFEPDFPTSAKQAEWFFNKETGTEVAGVVALDVTSMENLLQVLGPVDLADYNEKITSDNLFEKAIAHAEQNFFAGSQAKKTFLTALTNQIFDKIFFLPNQNWPGIVTALGKSLQSKHISIFFDDRKLFSYLISQNWAGVLPRPQEAGSGIYADFLAPVDANLGGNKANFYLDRTFDLQTGIGKNGEVSHRLKINYTNNSPSDTWPGGLYKNRFRVYLPIGTKLTKALWGEADITKDATAFVDYDRAGYSMLLPLAPKEQKALILEYSLPSTLEFAGDGASSKATYRLDVIKQAGTLKDPFSWKIDYPINYQVQSPVQSIGPQEQTINTDLQEDRSFEITFTRT